MPTKWTHWSTHWSFLTEKHTQRERERHTPVIHIAINIDGLWFTRFTLDNRNFNQFNYYSRSIAICYSCVTVCVSEWVCTVPSLPNTKWSNTWNNDHFVYWWNELIDVDRYIVGSCWIECSMQMKSQRPFCIDEKREREKELCSNAIYQFTKWICTIQVKNLRQSV